MDHSEIIMRGVSKIVIVTIDSLKPSIIGDRPAFEFLKSQINVTLV